MLVNYVGPLCAGIHHPALEGYDLKRFSPSCYLVEISQCAGINGPLIEGDVLVVDEQRIPQHDDLVVAVVDDEQRIYRTFRIGGGLMLIPTSGRSGSFPAQASRLRGVVVSQARRYVA